MSQHILLYTDEPGIGGIAQYNHAILRGLCQRGDRATLVQSKADTPLIAEQQGWGVHHEWLPFDSVRDFHQTLTQAEAAIDIFRRAQPDLILFSDGCPFSNLAAKQAALQLGIPYLVVIGFVDPELATSFEEFLPTLQLLYAQAKDVIAVSQENLSLLHRHFYLAATQGRVIHYGRPASYFTPPDPTLRDRLRQSVGIPPHGIVCFTAARLEGIKGYQYQLDAIAQLKHSPLWENLYFVWAGEGTLRDTLESALQELEVTDRVTLLGQRWDIVDWLGAADLFILPTYREGMPLAIMEAMAKGLPVIATAVSGIPEEMGDTGKLLPDPNHHPQATLQALVQTLQTWLPDPELRHGVGRAAQQRAITNFQEERMVQETLQVIDRSLLPSRDYVSPGLKIALPDAAFPHKIVGDPQICPWQYLRRDVPHNWYVDRRQPTVGFLSRDEAHILYNTALQFQGQRALEIGCWVGWSACHLALAGVTLDVVDPLLEQSEFYQTVHDSLSAAGVRDHVTLVAGYSPQRVEELAAQHSRKWSLIFIDGNHDSPGPLQDAIACELLAEPDAIILFHDLTSPEVTEGLDYLKQRGWHTMIYQTMQIMGVAWRGNVKPIAHQPDPTVRWSLPPHLQHYPVSGSDLAPSASSLQADPVLQLLSQVEQLSLLELKRPEQTGSQLSVSEQLAQWHQQGQQAYLRGDWIAAQAAYLQVLRYNPTSAIAHARLSHLFWQQGQISQSLQHHALAYAHPLSDRSDSEFQTLLASVRPYTLLSEERLFSLYLLTRQICLDDIPGNFVECGTFRGGAAALMAAVIQRYSLRPRQLYACDTFEGMPEPTEADRHAGIPANDTGFGVGTLKAPVAEYLNAVSQSLGVSEMVVPVKGLFADTLPQYQAEMGKIALLHADGDWYESTLDIFNHLYDSVVPEGFIQIDDYGHWEGCRQAVHEFERSRNLDFVLQAIDYTGVWCRKQDPAHPGYNPWRSLWLMAELSWQSGDRAMAERFTAAVLKLLPQLVRAEMMLINLGHDPGQFARPMHLPEAIQQDLQREGLVAEGSSIDGTPVSRPDPAMVYVLLCPDWQHPEEQLFPALVEVFQSLMQQSDRLPLTLFIHPGELELAEADLAISSVVMHLLTVAELELSEETLAIQLLNPSDPAEWQTLWPLIRARVAFAYENPQIPEPLSGLPIWQPTAARTELLTVSQAVSQTADPASSIHSLLQQIQDPAFWRELNPGLSILENWQTADPLSLEPEELTERLVELQTEGYFQLDAVLPEMDVFRMAVGVNTLMEQGLPPVFSFVYDEFWQIFQRTSRLLSAILGESYQQLPAFWTWFVSPSDQQTGWKPHRDHCDNTLRPDGTPNIVTVWIPLTDAFPLNGCMSVLPAHFDPNYPHNLDDCRVLNPQDIRALVAPAGSVLCWNHALLHWGGRSSHKAQMPRISVACEFQRSDVPPYQAGLMAADVLPNWQTRLQLIGQQILHYQHMHQLSDEMVAIATALSHIAG